MSNAVWSIAEAKAKLSEILRRARVGEPQVIGAQDPCVVLSMTAFADLQRKAEKTHLGRWLLDNTPKVDFEAPERSAPRANPFEA